MVLWTIVQRFEQSKRRLEAQIVGGCLERFCMLPHPDVVRFEREAAWVGVDNREEIGEVE